MEKVRIGIPNLDAMLGGGLVRGDAMLVKGGPGAGKTTLGLQWVCRGATDFGEPGAIIVLEGTPQQFYRRASAFGWDLRLLEEQNKVRTIFTSAEALNRDILTGSLLVGMLGEIGARRVTIDAITHYRLIAQDRKQLRQHFSSTINALKRIGQTSLLLAEEGTDGPNGPPPEEYLADSVISLGRATGTLGGFRRLDVLKSSTLEHHPRPALFRVTAAGIQVLCPFSPALDITSGSPPEGIRSLYDGAVGSRASGSFCIFQVEARLRRVLLDISLLAFLKSGSGRAVYLGSSSVNPSDLWEAAASNGLDRVFGGDHEEGAGARLLEPFGRSCPPRFPASQFQSLSGYDDRAIASLWGTEESRPDIGAPQGKNLIVCDLSDICFHLGPAKFRTLLPRLVDAARTRAVSLVGIVDPRLMAEDCRVWLEGASDGIVRIWEDDYGRFAQVVKGIGCKRHQPRFLIESDEPPFFELV